MNNQASVLVLVFAVLALNGCGNRPAPLLGTLEWDRVTVLAEASEPVLSWAVAEGDKVEAGAVLLELDARRVDAQLAQAHAMLASARAGQLDAEREYQRNLELRRKQLAPLSAADRARALRDQAAAAFAAATAALQEMQVRRDRLTVRAPRAGRIDSLPFRVGDQPPAGAMLASLLVGEAPYARIFVPASQRAALAPGMTMQLRVEGVVTPFAATVRSLRSEPAFTPYYALSGDDASRLVYRAEVVLLGAAARELPAGLPVTAVPAGGGDGAR